MGDAICKKVFAARCGFSTFFSIPSDRQLQRNLFSHRRLTAVNCVQLFQHSASLMVRLGYYPNVSRGSVNFVNSFQLLNFFLWNFVQIRMAAGLSKPLWIKGREPDAADILYRSIRFLFRRNYARHNVQFKSNASIAPLHILRKFGNASRLCRR